MNDLNSKTTEFNRARTVFVLIAGILALVALGVIPVGERIPYIGLIISSRNLSIGVLAILLVYLGCRLIIEWSKLSYDIRKLSANKFDFRLSLGIGLSSFIPSFYIVSLSILQTPVVVLSVLVLTITGIALGLLPGLCAEAYFSSRTQEEAWRLGLPTIPAFFRNALAGTTVMVVLAIAVILFINWLVPEVRNYSVGAVIFPLILVAVLYLMSSRAFAKAMKSAFDAHDAAYQLGGWDPSVPNRHSKFFMACKKGDAELARLYLEEGHDPNIQEWHGWTAIMIAAAENHLNLIPILLEFGAEVNMTNFHGRTALMYASRYGFNEMVNLLIIAGADPNKIPNHGPGALASAISWGHVGTAKILTQKGADVHNIDSKKGNALDLSRRLKSLVFVKYFASLNTLNQNKKANK